MSTRETQHVTKLFFDGARYAGWAKQPGKRTVQGELEHSLGVLKQESFRVRPTSRTDAGVSAVGQVVTFIGPSEESPNYVGLNRILPRDIAVTHVLKGQFTKTPKRYAYFFEKEFIRPALVRMAVHALPTSRVLGYLSRRGGASPTKTCSVWLKTFEGKPIALFSASSFGYEQVRRIVGLLQLVDRGVANPLHLGDVNLHLIRAAAPEGLVLLPAENGCNWIPVADGVQKANDYMSSRISASERELAKWRYCLRIASGR